jgi:hypothetical protein
MKQLLFGIIFIVSSFTYADGLDKMQIYINHQLVATSYEGDSQILELQISEGDTLSFEMWTDWGGMEKSSISIFDHGSSEQLAQLNRLSEKTYEAHFQQIIKSNLINSELLLVFNFSPKVNRTWKFARVVLMKKAKE